MVDKSNKNINFVNNKVVLRMENIFGNRLASARKMAGISLQELSALLGEGGVTRQALNKYEQGKMKPESKVLTALAKALNIKVDYFFTKPNYEIKLEDVEYRKFLTKISKPQQASIEEKAKAAFERYFELEDILGKESNTEYFKYSPIVKDFEIAELAAKELRKVWDLGYDAIPDVVEMLEDKGYKVAEIDAPEGFDGLKAKVNNEPVIALNSNQKDSSDIVRKRFTALHELAHHALKFPEEMKEKEQEKLCHAFASAVLYPEDMARRELHKDRFHFYEQELILLKERWGISISAIFSRAKQLELISEYVYKKFHIGFKQRGYHKPGAEPGRFLSKEKPMKLERLIYLGLAKEVLSINEAAYFAGINSWELRKKMNRLV